jgi:predicted esterase YcpF (UPF0227 family)
VDEQTAAVDMGEIVARPAPLPARSMSGNVGQHEGYASSTYRREIG